MHDSKDDETRFDEIAKERRLGSRLPETANPAPESFYRGMKEYANGIAEWQRKNIPFRRPLPRIVFDFVDSDFANAFAYSDGNRFFVGVEAGMVPLLIDMFYRLMSEPSVLKEVGDPSREEAGRHVYPIYKRRSHLEAEWAKRRITLADVAPRDPVRKHVAETMANWATLFFIQHEFRHLIAGHRDYLNECKAAGDDQPTLTNQAIELDADTFASAYAIRSMLMKVDNPEKWDPHWRVAFPNHRLGLTIYFVSAYATLRMDSQKQLNRSQWEYDAYPPERVRALLMFDRVLHFFFDWKREDMVPHYFPATGRAVADVERGFSLITGQPKDWSEMAEAIGEHVHKHRLTLAETWNDMIPELDKHSFVELPKVVIH